MISILTINGTPYDQSGRRSANYLIDGYGWDVDGDHWLEFHEHSSGPQPQLSGPVPVSLSVSGITVFSGDVISASPTIGGNGRTWCYRCMGLKYRANWIPVTALDGSGTIRFNTSPLDTDNYLPSFGGQSIGAILSYCLSNHAAALTAAGITTDATTAAQLAAQTLVPSEEVIVAGERLWQALEGQLQRYARNLRLVILASGLVRLLDCSAGVNHGLVLGTDPVNPPVFSRNWTHCATRTVVRGRGKIEAAYISTLKGTLTAAWSGAAQAAWTYSDFTNPGFGKDDGIIISVDGPTQVTVRSSNALRVWAANYWSGTLAWIYLTKTTGLGLTYTESRPVTACSIMAAGGTATVTLGYDLQNSAAGSFDSYSLIGTNVPLSSGGRGDVWRLYNVTDPGLLVANHLVRAFPAQQAFVDYFGQAANLTSTPTGQLVSASGAGPANFQVLPATGQILFFRPVLEISNSIAAMTAGGSAVTAPVDVYLLLAYSRGALSTAFPPDSGGSPVYSGTAYTAAGLARTNYADVDSWAYSGNTALMNGLASMYQASTRDTILEGPVNYYGFWSALQDPDGGHLLSFSTADPTYPGGITGDENLRIPVRAVDFRFITDGGGLLYRTSARCSTRRDPRTGAGQYTHLSQLGSGGGFGGQLGGAFTGGMMGFAGRTGLAASDIGQHSDMELGDPGERQKWAARKAQGVKGVSSTRLDRQEAAARHTAIDKDQRENARRMALDHNDDVAKTMARGPGTGLVYGAGPRKDRRSGVAKDREESQRRSIARVTAKPRPRVDPDDVLARGDD